MTRILRRTVTGGPIDFVRRSIRRLSCKHVQALAIFLLVSMATTLRAQTSSDETIPDRGFHPASSYALSNIETINTTNGNLMLNIPLASLPKGRGGNPGFQLVLRYNSKIWDGDPDRVENPNNPSQLLDVVFLTRSDDGGWDYNLHRYNWSLYNRNDGGVGFPPPDCRHFNIWKMKVTFPDGSMREFRPYGFDDQCNDNYFTVLPAANRSYFSTDGTYARLDFGSSTSEWTLRFADGTKVTNQSGVQRTYDRNGNYTEIQDVANYNNTGHPATVVSDQLGRTIVVERATGEDYVHVAGTNGNLVTTTVKWGTTSYVNKTYRAGNHFQYDVNINNQGIPGVKEIILPSQLGTNLKFTFGYNGWPTTPNSTPSVGWGELSSVTLPSGAQATYQYELNGESGPGLQADFVLKNSPTRKDLNYNLEYDGSVTAAPTETWLYSISTSFSATTAPDGGITKEWFGDVDGNLWNSGLVHKTERPDGSVIDRVWTQNRPFMPPGVTIFSSVGVNPFVEKESTSIPNAAGTLVKTSTKEYRRDKNGNVTQIKEYDWVPYGTAPTSAQLKKVTTTTYHAATPDYTDTTTDDTDTYARPGAPAYLNAVATVEIGNGTQTLARDEFTYDNATSTGNLTQQRSWDSAKGAYSNPLALGNSIVVSNQYDPFGNVTQTTDARGFVIKTTYGSINNFLDLYPTEVIRAFGTIKQLTQTLDYDFHTGKVKRVTDVDNSVVLQETDYDDLGRAIEVRLANNVPEVKSVTRTEYSVNNRRVISRSDLNTPYDGKLVRIQHFDQLGRPRLMRQLENSTQDATNENLGIKVQTRYTFSGGFTYELVSNPYRATTSSGASGESTMGWSRTKSDEVGRVVELQMFGGTALPAPWNNNAITTGTVSTSYEANFATTTEETGLAPLRSHRTVTDGLGRVVRVDEQDGTYNLGTPDLPTQPTVYSYDALGNLVTVNQGVQIRTFNYSSLSRLVSAINPENGTVSFQYDNNGNLKQKIDARPVTTTFGDYDPLNRPTTLSYSDGTPTVTYSYDAITTTNGKGKLTSISSSTSTFVFKSYDALGRAKSAETTMGSQIYLVSYTYDLAGNVKSVTYPSGRSVNTTYDDVGRTNSVNGNLGDNLQRNYAVNITYSTMGGLSQEQFGTTTPIYNKRFYNSRGQLAEIRSATTSDATNWNRGALFNHFSQNCGGICSGISMPDNNGNLRKQEIKIPHDDQMSASDTYLQVYEYDELNRLKSVNENKNGGTTQWQQSYTYDRYGNRSINTAGGATFGGINSMQAAVVPNTPTNRLYAPNETEQNHPLFNYDGAGNQTKDYFSVSGINFDRSFDAENRMITSIASGSVSHNAAYSYDGNGRRVRRTINGVETWHIYGLRGELLGEYAANGPANAPQKEYAYRADRLLVVATPGTASGSPPSSLNATSAAGGTQVSLSWSPVSGATNYRVERKAAGQSFVHALTSSSTSGLDSNVSPGNAYLYKVCVADSGGNCTSSFGNVVLGTTTSFATDLTLVSIGDDPSGLTVTLVKAAHITELRSAVTAVRNLAGRPAASWTNPVAPGAEIKKEDITDLRNRLDEALSDLGIPISDYEDQVLTGGSSGTLIKKVHITQLRQRATTGIGGSGGGGGTTVDLRWLITDHLGTPRIILDKSGSLSGVTRHDYLPFGEELIAPTGGRSTTHGYQLTDGVRQKLTSKERDAEASLDYFGARYYASNQGRFVGVDPQNADAKVEVPQSWNGYSFTRNNPLLYVDRDGQSVTICGPDGKSDCYEHSNKEFAKLRKFCEQSGECKIIDDRLTGGRIVQNGQVIGTFSNDLDAWPGGELNRELNRDEVWNRAAVSAIWNVTIGKFLCGIFCNKKPGPPAPKPPPANTVSRNVSRGSTGRSQPANLHEQLAMQSAQANPAGGTQITNIVMNDPRWPASQGWVKMRQNVNGHEIHYVRNTHTGEVDDWKFKE